MTLPSVYEVRQWRVTWVGFDALLMVAMAATALLGWLRHRAVIVSATTTAVLLICDAWFDVSLLTFMLIGQVWANHHIMFDHIRSADRVVLFLNTMLLMDVALLPFAASVLAEAFRDGHGQRTAVVFHGAAFALLAVLFNVIWRHVRRDRRLLSTTIDAAGAAAISRRFRLALVWLATAILLGALVPVLGVAVIATFIIYFWLPIPGEIAAAKRRRGHRT